MSDLTYQGWVNRVERLCEAVVALEGVADAMGLPTPIAGWHEALFAKLKPQLARAPFLVVAVTGGTNTGKSAIFNNLLQSKASRVTATAMGSKHPVCILPRDFRDRADLDRIFPGFVVRPWTSEEDPLTDTHEHLLFYREDPGGMLPSRLVLLDTPDVDGALSDHWERARLVRGAADVLLGVLTQQKHNDAAVRRFFSEAADAEKVVFAVFNMVQWPDDRDDCKAWLRVFCKGTRVDPARVYVAPHARQAAERLELPFVDLDGERQSPVNDLANLRFDEIKVRTFRGALRQVLDDRDGLPAFLRAIAARAAEYAEIGILIAETGRVEMTPPSLPNRVVVDMIRDWFEDERTRFDRTVHGAYSKLGGLLLAPLLGTNASADQDYKHQELVMLSKALKTVLDRLEEKRRAGGPLLRTELDRILGGSGREEIFKALAERHAKTKVLTDDYAAFVRRTLDRFKADNPRLIRTIRYGLIATAVVRPVLTLVMLGGPAVASELAHQAAVHTATQVAGELAVGTAVTVSAEGAAVSLQGPVLGLLTRLFTRFYEERAALISSILHDCVLGRGLDRIGALDRAARGAPFLDAKDLVESLARDLADSGGIAERQ